MVGAEESVKFFDFKPSKLAKMAFPKIKFKH